MVFFYFFVPVPFGFFQVHLRNNLVIPYEKILKHFDLFIILMLYFKFNNDFRIFFIFLIIKIFIYEKRIV